MLINEKILSNSFGFMPCLVSVDGGWGQWSPWQPCSETCGEGTQERYRHCDNPTPENGGQDCVGSEKDLRTCRSENCASENVVTVHNAVKLYSVVCITRINKFRFNVM